MTSIRCPHGYPIGVEHGWTTDDKHYTCAGGQVVGYRPVFTRRRRLGWWWTGIMERASLVAPIVVMIGIAVLIVVGGLAFAYYLGGRS